MKYFLRKMGNPENILTNIKSIKLNSFSSKSINNTKLTVSHSEQCPTEKDSQSGIKVRFWVWINIQLWFLNLCYMNTVSSETNL